MGCAVSSDALELIMRKVAGFHARAVCREWRIAYDATHIHLFMRYSGSFPLPPCNSGERWRLHEKARRLLFVHETTGTGEGCHVVLRHPKNEADRRAAIHYKY
jgi:hypothetical protein